MELKISNEAFLDIESILQYSIETFGIQKAEEYLHHLYGKISKIAKMPSIGHTHKQLPKDLKIYNVERHIVVYRVIEDESIILVVRILHQKVNLSSVFD